MMRKKETGEVLSDLVKACIREDSSGRYSSDQKKSSRPEQRIMKTLKNVSVVM